MRRRNRDLKNFSFDFSALTFRQPEHADAEAETEIPMQMNWNENYTAEQNAAASRGAAIFNAQADRSRGAGTVFRVRPTRRKRR